MHWNSTTCLLLEKFPTVYSNITKVMKGNSAEFLLTIGLHHDINLTEDYHNAGNISCESFNMITSFSSLRTIL